MIFKPQPFNPKKIEVFHARSISIETRRRAHFQVDGEYLGKVKKIQGSIDPGSLLMVLPAKSINT
jgi:diacylglycerol kinase family enzyme